MGALFTIGSCLGFSSSAAVGFFSATTSSLAGLYVYHPQPRPSRVRRFRFSSVTNSGEILLKMKKRYGSKKNSWQVKRTYMRCFFGSPSSCLLLSFCSLLLRVLFLSWRLLSSRNLPLSLLPPLGLLLLLLLLLPSLSLLLLLSLRQQRNKSTNHSDRYIYSFTAYNMLDIPLISTSTPRAPDPTPAPPPTSLLSASTFIPETAKKRKVPITQKDVFALLLLAYFYYLHTTLTSFLYFHPEGSCSYSCSFYLPSLCFYFYPLDSK